MQAPSSDTTDPPESPEVFKGTDPNPSPEEKAFINEMVALSATGVLIRKGKISIRMFSMGGGKTTTAYLLQESVDGFIVALPAVLNSDKGDVSADFISPVPLVKFYKTGIPMMALPTPSIFYNYLRLTKERFGTLPGYFNDERKAQVDALLVQIKENFSVEPPNTPSPSSSVKRARVPEPEYNDFLSEDNFFVSTRKPKYRH